MIRPTSAFALIGLALLAASCRSGPTDERRQQWERGAGIRQKVTGYYTIVSAHTGKVGFVKTYDVSDFGGSPYEWKYVYDRNWKELGFIDQFGKAYVYDYYSPSEQAFRNEVLRLSVLPSDSIERNVMRMLGIDTATDQVTLPKSEPSDITDDTNGDQHLAGPGIVPVKAPVEAPVEGPTEGTEPAK
jgi:hypothetical protein